MIGSFLHINSNRLEKTEKIEKTRLSKRLKRCRQVDKWGSGGPKRLLTWHNSTSSFINGSYRL